MFVGSRDELWTNHDWCVLSAACRGLPVVLVAVYCAAVDEVETGERGDRSLEVPWDVHCALMHIPTVPNPVGERFDGAHEARTLIDMDG